MKQSIIDDNNLPLKINMISLINNYNNWNKEVKVIYVLKGEIAISFDKKIYNMRENDFILVNAYEFTDIQSVSLGDAIFLEFLIDDSYYNRLYKNFSYIQFKCISLETVLDKNKYNQVREYLSKLLTLTKEKREENNLLTINILNDFILYLIDNFKIKMDKKDLSKDMSNKIRIIKIFEFLEENYDDYNLKIDDIATAIDLNPQYTLRLFKKDIGIGLIEFLNSLRLKKSLPDLLYTNKSILEISIENGFNDNKIYNRIFKKYYDITPGQYRKRYLLTKTFKEKKKIAPKDNPMDVLLNYSQTPSSYENNSNLKMEVNLIELDLNQLKETTIKPYWKKILCLGRAYEGLKGDVQYQLKQSKSEIDFEYLKINSIFGSEMFIYNEDRNGNPFYNFIFLDKLIDFILEIKMKPFINIGFMPQLLKSKDVFLFSEEANVSPPKDMRKWNNLIIELTKHLIERYGLEEICTWYFEIWNNPSFEGIFWHGTEEEYFDFFKNTFDSIKGVFPSIKVGGPSTLINSEDQWKWNERFLNYLKQNELEIDFFSYHSYGMTSIDINEFSPALLNEGSFHYIEEDFVEKSIKMVKSKLKNNYKKDIEVIITEWNSSPYFLDLVHDTCYMVPFILKNVINNFNSVNALGYWTFTDIFEEHGIGSEMFHGGVGIFTINNLKKSSYNAFLLLSKLGNQMLGKGKNYCISKRNKSYQFILFNHASYTKKYEKENIKTVDKNDRYKAFDEKRTQEFFLSIDNFKEGNYLVTKYYLDRNNGSIYDAWLNMGAPKKLTKDVMEYLKSKEKMKITIDKINVKERLDIKEIIEPHGVVFLEIERTV